MIISKSTLYSIIREELYKEFEEHTPWTPDEEAERRISHADREARELMKQFRGDIKRRVGRVWGDESVERREKEVAAAAAESLLPRLHAALKLPAGEARNDEVKHVVYTLSNLDPFFYKPSDEELAGFRGDPAKAGEPSARQLKGTLPSLGIDLANE